MNDHPTTSLESPELYGTDDDGREVHAYAIAGPDDGAPRLRVLTLGAVVGELWVADARGERANVVLGSPDLAGYLAGYDDFYGAVVGRYANRVRGGRLVVDGRVHQLDRNEGEHTLHGGLHGFHRRVWDVVAHSPSSITLRLVSPDGDQGFPGELTATVRYDVTEHDVVVSYQATTTATTVVSLTQHAHVNLAGEASGTIDDHLLTVAADRFTPVDDDLLPTGELAAVDATPFDLRRARRVGDVLAASHEQLERAGGLDHNFVLDGDAATPCARLEDPGSGRVMEVFTDRPGLQVYSGNVFDATHVGTGGVRYGPRAGIALETQAFPDSPHHAGTPGWTSVDLRPGQTHRSTTRWRFTCA